MNKFFSSLRRTSPVDAAIIVIGLAMVIYQMAYVPLHFQTTILLRNNHLLGCMLLVGLSLIKKQPRRWPIYTLFLIASAAPLIYVQIFYSDIQLRNFMLNPLDLALGTLLVLTVLIGGYLSFGWVLPTVSIIIIIYSFIGYLLPGTLATPHLSFARIISWLSLGFTGIYGVGLQSSAEFVFLFIIFGVILQRTGGVTFFLELAKLLAGRLRGGVGQTAVISSGLIGMITGSSIGNVAMGGVYTIPTMIKAGYKPQTAASIEAAASVGGQLYPPIMGAAAFLMAAFLGVPYLTVVVAAIVPSFIYFGASFTACELISRQQGIQRQQVHINYDQLWPRIPLFVIPLTVIVIFLLQGLSAMWAGFGGVVTLIAVSLILKQTRLSPMGLVKAAVDGAAQGAVIGVACAVIGPIIETVSFTGLDIKLPSMIEAWGQGNLFLSAAICAAICVLLGAGMPTSGAYMCVALMAGPAMHQMGLSLLQSHFFVFYWSILSALTPPIAGSIIPAASIAGSNYLKTCLEATRIAIPAFLGTFLFLYNPILLGEWSGQPASWIIITIVATLLGILPLSAGYIGYFIVKLSFLERILFFLSAAGLWICVATGSYISLALGIILLFGGTMFQWQKMKRAESALVGVPAEQS